MMRGLLRAVVMGVGFFGMNGVQAWSQPSQDVGSISLDSLLNIPVSTATRYTQSVRYAPATVSNISADDIQRYGYQTLAEAIGSLRGFYLTYDRDYTYLGVRGFSRPGDYNNRILVMLNGHALNENTYGQAFMGTEFPIPMEAIDHIEVIRGPGSALYGTGAVFASINVFTKNGGDLNGILCHVHAGSGTTTDGTVTGGGDIGGGTALLLSTRWGQSKGKDLYFPEFDSPETFNGIAHGLDGDRYGSVLASLESGKLSMTAFASTREKDVPTAPYATTFGSPLTTRDQRHSVEGRYRWNESETFQIQTSLHLDHYHYAGGWPYGVSSEYDATDGWWTGMEVVADIVPNESNHLIIGGTFERSMASTYELWEGADKEIDINAPFQFGSLFIQEECQVLPILTAVGGIRHDAYSRAGSTTSPRIGLVCTPGQSMFVKLLYGEAFRVPNTYELFYGDEDGDLDLGVIRNSGLQSERIRSLEFALGDRLSKRVFTSVTLFVSRIDRLIDQVVVSTDGTSQYQNTSGATSQGVEVGVSGELPGGRPGYVYYTYAWAHRLPNGGEMENSPKHLLRLGYVEPIFPHCTATLEASAESRRITPREGTTPAFGLLNIGLTYAPPGTSLRASIRARNVLNAPYRLPGGYELTPQAIQQDGRSVAITMDYFFRTR